MAHFTFEAIGTTWKIDVYDVVSATDEANLLSKIKTRIGRFEETYSRFREDSLVTLISKKAGRYTLPADALDMLSLYHDLYKLTNGYFTPLVGELLSDAGYDAKYSLKQKRALQAPPQWDEVLEYNHPILIVKQPVKLDFGAAGKGYLIDLVAMVLEDNGIQAYCIDAGGDIVYKNNLSLRVGLEDPEDTSQAIGVCVLTHGSICGSAGNRRVWANFTHIIDPKTLTSPRNTIAVWVTAERALLADAIATCLFFVDAGTLRRTYDFEYVIIKSDRSFEKSDKFPGELFVNTVSTL